MDKEEEVSTDSNDREVRIQARRNRIEFRSNAKNVDNGKSKTQTVEAKRLSRGQQQVSDSLNLLDRRKLKGIEEVTNIRAETDSLENSRRIREEDRRNVRLEKLQEEAIVSGKRNAAVEMRWAELLDYNMPQELYNEISSQKSACGIIMKSKDDIIKEFQSQLKLKDEEYVRTLKQQAEEIEKLIERMGHQFKEMQEEYEVELDQIEDAFLKERDELLTSNKSEIDALFEKRRAMEMAYMESKQDRDEKNQREIEELRVKDAEDYNKLKIKLETDIQTLEQQLEEMRATYQLNTEKLEYNYRVLTERDMENSATLSQQKRKLSRLKDALSSLMQKYTQTDIRDRHQNQELTEEYRRITKQYKDLQIKFRHFEVADNKRFEDVWKMHEEEVNAIVKKVLQADKIMHEQLLDWEWNPPSQDLRNPYSDEVDPSLSSPPSILPSTGNALSPVSTGGPGEVSNGTIPLLANGLKTGLDGNDIQSVTRKSSQVSITKLKLMLQMLSSEAGFLLDNKVRKAIESLDEKEAALLQADSMLRTLGVENESDMEKLLGYFFHNTGDNDDEEEEDDEIEAFNGEEGRDVLKELGLKVTPDDVVRVIKQFVEEIDENKRNESAAKLTKRAITLAEDGISELDDTRRNKLAEEEKKFWDRVSNVIPPKTIRVWGSLENGLAQYTDILSKRSGLIDEVSSLKNQNAELKALLRQYLGAEVNDELIVPPTQTIRVQPTNN